MGSGPLGPQLARRHPEVHFAGIQTQAELARFFRAADVFVFPSRTDTFGLVMLEALACGTPVAAYPVAGPLVSEAAAFPYSSAHPGFEIDPPPQGLKPALGGIANGMAKAMH